MSCDFREGLREFIEFYVDKEGRLQVYGHPLPLSNEAAEAGIAGVLNDHFCPRCGHVTPIPSFLTEKARDHLELYSTLLLGTRKIVDIDNPPRTREVCNGPLLSGRETYRRLFKFKEEVQIGKCNMALVNAVLGGRERSGDFFAKALSLLSEPGFELYPDFDIQEVYFCRSAEVITLLHETLGGKGDYGVVLQRLFDFNREMDYRYKAPYIFPFLRLAHKLRERDLILRELKSWVEEIFSNYTELAGRDLVFLLRPLLALDREYVREILDEFLESKEDDELLWLVGLGAVGLLREFLPETRLRRIVEHYHKDFTAERVLDKLYVYHLLQLVASVLEEFGKGEWARRVLEKAWKELLSDSTPEDEDIEETQRAGENLESLLKLAIVTGGISTNRLLARQVKRIEDLFEGLVLPTVWVSVDFFQLVEELLTVLDSRGIRKEEFLNRVRSFFQSCLDTGDPTSFSPRTDRDFFFLSYLSVFEAKFGSINSATKQLKKMEEYLSHREQKPRAPLPCPKCKKGILMLEGTWVS